MGKDYYEILGVKPDATRENIANSFRKLAIKYHPLRDFKDLSEKSYMFTQICEAYDVLSNIETKNIYDQYGEELLKEGIPAPNGKLKGGYAFHGDYLETFRNFFGTSNPYWDITIPIYDNEEENVEDKRINNHKDQPTIPLDDEAIGIFYSSKDDIPDEIPMKDIRRRGHDLIQTYHITLQDALLSIPISIITFTGERIELAIGKDILCF